MCVYDRMAEIEACYPNRDGLSGRRRLRRKRNRIVSLGRGNPFVGALHSSVLICPYLLRLVSSSSFSLSLALVECLDFSTNPRINPPSSSGKPPGTRTLETSTISFPLTYTADPSTGVHAFAKELNQNNKQTRKSDYRGGPCLDVSAARNRESDYLFSLFLSTEIYRGDLWNKISN